MGKLSKIVAVSPSCQGVYWNALFLIVLLFLGKANPMAIVFAYVLETIIIGVFHVGKLVLILRNNPLEKTQSGITSYFMIPFFLLHYGFFVAIQSVFIYIGFAIKDERFSTSLQASNFLSILSLEGFYWVFLSLIATHSIQFYFHFYKNKKYNEYSLNRYFMKPYLRIVIQQFLAIIPFFFLIIYDHVGIIAALLLIGMRTFLDVYLSELARHPEKLDKVARSLMKTNQPEELPEIKKTLQVFLED
ncbi:DUF6498-containing protein [Flavobacterium faecale]|uniref:DUF6498-containing protein n=1 Tax=Flavobacterium faecale TaxID=1355330 RepID=UPI003AAF540E